MTGMPARFLMMFVAAVGLAIGSAEAGAAPKEFGQCTLPEGESISLDGTCGEWSVVSAKKKPKSIIDVRCRASDGPEKPFWMIVESKAIIDFSCPASDGPEKPLTIVEPKTIIDFSYITRDEPASDGPEKPLTIVRVCVSKGHNSHKDDRLLVATRGSRDENSNQSWTLKRSEKRCRYLPLRPGMKLTVLLTNRRPELTVPGRSASGTWAIVK